MNHEELIANLFNVSYLGLEKIIKLSLDERDPLWIIGMAKQTKYDLEVILHKAGIK